MFGSHIRDRPVNSSAPGTRTGTAGSTLVLGHSARGTAPATRPRARMRDCRYGRCGSLNRGNGQYRVWSGPASMRTILYMATVTATRHNPVIRDFQTCLCQRGNPKKVALVMAMCKLLLILNIHGGRQRDFQALQSGHGQAYAEEGPREPARTSVCGQAGVVLEGGEVDTA